MAVSEEATALTLAESTELLLLLDNLPSVVADLRAMESAEQRFAGGGGGHFMLLYKMYAHCSDPRQLSRAASFTGPTPWCVQCKKAGLQSILCLLGAHMQEPWLPGCSALPDKLLHHHSPSKPSVISTSSQKCGVQK